MIAARRFAMLREVSRHTVNRRYHQVMVSRKAKSGGCVRLIRVPTAVITADTVTSPHWPTTGIYIEVRRLVDFPLRFDKWHLLAKSVSVMIAVVCFDKSHYGRSLARGNKAEMLRRVLSCLYDVMRKLYRRCRMLPGILLLNP